MKHIMCVRLKQWPIDRLRRRRPQLRHNPLVLVQAVAARQLIAVACDAAMSAGIRPGMTLAEARALSHGLAQAEYEPDKDRESLESVARWMIRFSPTVAIEPPDTIALDITGSERLFGGWNSLILRVSQSLTKFGLSHGIAIAPTVGAAWALASFSTRHQVVAIPQLLDSLRPLPIVALRLDIDCVTAFYELGIETVDQLMRLPRKTLPARFGPSVLTRLDQALGLIAEPLKAIQQSEVIQAKFDFDGAVESLEVILEAFMRLLNDIRHQLQQQGCGARKLVAEFLSSQSPVIQKDIFLSRPTCDVATLFNLLRCAIETIKGADEGFVGLRLSVPIFERLEDEQLRLLADEEEIAETEIDHLLERLRVRIGESAVVTPQLVEAHLPEKSFRCVPILSNASNARMASKSATVRPKSRPLHLLAEPVEIRCTAAPLREFDATPVSFTFSNAVYQVVHASGPERIAGPWWEGRNKTRNYFDVEVGTGRRFWLFQVPETRRWYLHGIFDC